MNIKILKNVKLNEKTNLILLIIERIISGLGISTFNFALSLYVMDLTQSSVAFSTLLSFAIIPGIFVNIFAGVFVDTHNKKRILVISELLCGIIVILFMFLFQQNNSSFLLLTIYIIIINILQALFTLTLNASIPEIVGVSIAPKANSLFQGVSAVINIIGPLAGAVLYGNLKMEFIFLTEGCAFIIASIAASFIVFANANKTVDLSISFINNVKAVFLYINTQQVLKFLFIAAIILNTIMYPMLYLVINFITYNILGLTEYHLSAIQSAIAVGTILGAIFIITRRTTATIMKKFFLLLKIQSVLIALWFFPKLTFFNDDAQNIIAAVYVVLVLLYTMFNTIQNIPLITHFQLSVPDNLRGRLFGVFLTAQNISIPIGMWIYGLLLERVNWVFIPIFSGIIVFVISTFSEKNKYYKEFVNNL